MNLLTASIFIAVCIAVSYGYWLELYQDIKASLTFDVNKLSFNPEYVCHHGEGAICEKCAGKHGIDFEQIYRYSVLDNCTCKYKMDAENIFIQEILKPDHNCIAHGVWKEDE
ncbi:hypothetical protein CMI37_29040 [Candidatus Pacearchaeota archaeon]|nr:hypothetical protein [Candidatus Pacearchaeota archaeon]